MSKINVNKLVWVLIPVLFLFLFFYEKKKRNNRVQSSEYVTGKITRIDKNAVTYNYVAYEFVVNGKVYKGSVEIDFCKECDFKCCQPGAKVTVRYEKGNPKNNDIVSKP